MISVIIADDHQLILDGLGEALSALPDITIAGTAGDGQELITLLHSTHPDVMLVDIEMPNMDGLSALRRLSDAPPTIVVTMHTGEEELKRARAVGAVAFLSKSTPLPDLAAAIRAAAAGERLIDDDDPTPTLDRYRDATLDEGAASLTVRERELLRLLARGVSSTEDLADRLFISQKTVKNHLANIYEKLAITDRAQAAVEAIRLGLNR